jgi:sugar-specific transcriptional regulator TrmB
MRPQNDELDVFTRLGLMGRQAEVYLEFVKLKQSTVKTVAKNAS